MMQLFDELPWHDAVLHGIHIDRRQAGVDDHVSFDIEWPDGTRQTVKMEDVFQANLHLNFGVQGAESIRSAQMVTDHPELDRVREKWRRVGVELSDLILFQLSTNSTASEIQVIARGFTAASVR